MDDLRELLHDAAARPEGPFDAEDVRRRVRRRHRRRVASAAAGVVAVVLVGAAGIVSILEEVQRADETEVELAPAPPERREAEPRELEERQELEEPRELEEPGEPGEAPDPDGTWSELPSAPIEGRAGAEAVWTGEEVLVWGGAPDAEGAAYDPAAEEWRELPEAPIAPREHHVAVWTGEELVVWGGVEALPAGESGDAEEPLGDGAAYDPSADEWRLLPEAPIDGRSGAAAAWTGEELVIAGGSAAGADPGTLVDRRDGAAYDPAADSWRAIAELPEASAGATEGVWTGEEVVVPVGTHLNPTAAAAYDPGDDAWRELADAPAGPVPGSGSVVAWTGEEVAVVFGGFDEENPGGVAAYEPAADGWRELPEPPVAPGAPPEAVWGDQRLIVLGGDGGEEGESLAVAYLDAGGDEWATDEGPLGAAGRRAVAWTGEELFVWGGVSGAGEEAEARGDGATWIPPQPDP